MEHQIDQVRNTVIAAGAKLQKAGQQDPNASYLKTQTEDWVPADFAPGRKSLRRAYFMGA